GRTCERKRPDDRPAKRQRAAGRRGRLRVHQPRGAVGGSDVSPRPAGRWASDRGRLAARGTVAVAAGLAGSACASSFGAPAGGTDQGADMHRLWAIFFVAGLLVGGLTLGLILWSAVRYRRRAGDTSLPPQFRQHVPIEIAYVAIPIGIVIALFLLTVSTE